MNISGVGPAYAYAYTPTTGSLGASSLAGASAPSAADEFRAWARMTPAERMRANILSSLGLDESKLAAMSEKEREKVEAKIREMIEEKVRQDTEKKTGVLVDKTV
jgi:hypothetical protein